MLTLDLSIPVPAWLVWAFFGAGAIYYGGMIIGTLAQLYMMHVDRKRSRTGG